METVATENSTCSNGFAGIEDTLKGVCCDAACGMCGGVGCGNLPGLTGSECCSDIIETSGSLCDEVGQAPCILAPPCKCFFKCLLALIEVIFITVWCCIQAR